MESEERIVESKEHGDPVQSVDDDNAAETGVTATAYAESPENGLKRKRSPLPEGMTRSAYKKMKRQQEWAAGKADRRAKEKEHKKKKKQEIRAAIQAGEIAAPLRPEKKVSTLVPVTFVIDCAFDELMHEPEIKSLASQITRCYSDNSKARYRAHIAVSSFNKRLKTRFDTVLQKHHEGWKGIKFYEEDFVEVATRAKAIMKIKGKVEGAIAKDGDQAESESQEGEVIYLSSESENTIERLDPYCTYIIGGLVDRNRHKGICYKSACERGIKTAKLPIGEFMEMNSRYVLATNHVNEIMLQWLESGDWGQAFMKVMPKRKGGTLKGQEGQAVDDDEGNDELANGDLDQKSPVDDEAEHKAEDANNGDAAEAAEAAEAVAK